MYIIYQHFGACGIQQIIGLTIESISISISIQYHKENNRSYFVRWSNCLTESYNYFDLDLSNFFFSFLAKVFQYNFKDGSTNRNVGICCNSSGDIVTDGKSQHRSRKVSKSSLVVH